MPMPGLNTESIAEQMYGKLDVSQFNSSNISIIYEEQIIGGLSKQQFFVLLPSFILTAILMCVGFPGNLLVILVYWLKMARTTSRHFIISLAVCDFINCAFGMPVELALMSNIYDFEYPILCKVSRFCTFFMNNTSSLVIVGIAIDRFRRVWMPLRPNMTVKHSKIICICSAVFSAISAGPALFIYGTHTIPLYGPTNSTKIELQTCYVNDDFLHTIYPLVFSLYLFIGTVAIIVIITILYGLVGKVVCGRQKLSQEGVMFRQSFNTTIRTENLDSPSRNEKTFTTKFLRSLSEHSPNLLRSKGQRSPKLSGVKEITEPFAVRDGNNSQASVRRHGGKEIRAGRTTMILSIVALVFVLSFIPYLAIATIRYTKPTLVEDMSRTELSIYNFFFRSYFINSAVNPIIYCFLNRQFRSKVKMFFMSIFKCKK